MVDLIRRGWKNMSLLSAKMRPSINYSHPGQMSTMRDCSLLNLHNVNSRAKARAMPTFSKVARVDGSRGWNGICSGQD